MVSDNICDFFTKGRIITGKYQRFDAIKDGKPPDYLLVS
jgi:hypothetical protein